MITAGVDVGSRTAKAVIMEDDKIIASYICDTILKGRELVYITINEALKKTGLSLKDIQYTVATGYGRFIADYADEGISEISCHSKGIHWYFPTVRTILDVGGQDSKAITCDEKGRITNFIMNDKCAGGTGRFLEVIAEVFGVPFENIGKMALEAKENLTFSSICVVFAKTEALAMFKEGISKTEIIGGLCRSVANIVLKLLARLSFQKDLSITGGVGKNIGIIENIAKELNLKPLVAPDPQIVGALGASLFARERLLARAS